MIKHEAKKMSEQPSTAFVLGTLAARLLIVALCGFAYVRILVWIAPDAPVWAKVLAVYISLMHSDLAIRIADFKMSVLRR